MNIRRGSGGLDSGCPVRKTRQHLEAPPGREGRAGFCLGAPKQLPQPALKATTAVTAQAQRPGQVESAPDVTAEAAAEGAARAPLRLMERSHVRGAYGALGDSCGTAWLGDSGDKRKRERGDQRFLFIGRTR